MIALDASAGAARARRASSPTTTEVRVEWHEGDAADLAFLRADSIDLALAAGRARARSRTSTGSSARCTACCAPGAAFVFSHDHPMRARGRARRRRARRAPARARSRSGAPTSTARPIDVDARRRARSSCARARSPTCSPRCTAPATASTCCSSPSRCARPTPDPPIPTVDHLAGAQGRRLSARRVRRRRCPRSRAQLGSRSYASSSVDRALVEPELEQEVERLADDRGPGATPRNSITCVAVERRPDLRRAPPARRSSAMRASSSSMRRASARGLALRCASCSRSASARSGRRAAGPASRT